MGNDVSSLSSLILTGNAPWILAVTFVGGLLTAFTPCVYPLIPVTLGLLGVRDGTSGWRSWRSSLLFVLGLAIVYTILGSMAAWTGHLFGSLTQRPWVGFAVASIFAVMGFGMLGLFDFRLPPSVNRWLAGRSGSGGRGALVVGATSGLLAAPCSGPIVAAILAYVRRDRVRSMAPFFSSYSA
jgi:thioredoxin:protein disulfide reductase